MRRAAHLLAPRLAALAARAGGAPPPIAAPAAVWSAPRPLLGARSFAAAGTSSSDSDSDSERATAPPPPPPEGASRAELLLHEVETGPRARGR
jgi:hypothetical protein